MWISRKQTAIALTLLLTSCGAEAASSSEISTPDASVSPTTAVEPSTTPVQTSVGQPIVDSKAGFPARLAVSAQDGQVVTFSPDADPVVTDGASSPTGEVVVSSDTIAGRSTIEWHDVRTDAISATTQIEGEVRPTAIAQDGKLVALTGIIDDTTTVVLATPSLGEVRRWTFDALLVPEAFSNSSYPGGDGLPVAVFVIEYLDTNTYRVRVIDTQTGALGLPLNLRDKTELVDEVMTAVSRTNVFDPVNQLLFTLYQDATEGGEDVGSFIHTLGLANGVWCLDVPAELGLAENPGALAVSPDGSRLFAASATGGIAGYVISDVTASGPDMPEARATAALKASAARVAVGASDDQVVVALGGSLFRLDPATLEVRDSFDWDMNVDALTVLDDGSVIIVGTGRMTLVSAENQLLAERPLPASVSEVTRVAVLA